MPKAKNPTATGLTDTWGRSNRKIPDKTCEYCGNIFRPVDSTKRTCSRECGLKIRSNGSEKLRRPESWWQNSKGYIQGHVWENGKKRQVKQHRWVMEQHLGRRLEKWEDVHHIDKDKTHNALSNLRLLTHAEHSSLHNNGRKYKKGYKLNLTEEQRKAKSERMKKYRASGVINPHPARNQKLSPEQRSNIASKAGRSTKVSKAHQEAIIKAGGSI